ncbi:MAG: ABC transporter ATP-binding protein [Ignavibacteriales bacterium]|nr:ABC transporter ATP-binding protein [Ignavibacteriales bacterium]
MLKINHIIKNFENINALNNVSLTIPKGEFFGLLGPNGAGKSTLMNIIIGYLEADSGQVYIGEEKISSQNIQLRKKIGYVPQEVSLYLELSAYKNLKIFGELYGITSKKLESKIEYVLDLVQLKDRKKDQVKEFSGGMKRRLNLAASLLHDPEIVLCDEPTVGVDPQSRNAIFDMLSELNKSGKTIVYTTHYMEEAERLCSRLAIIDHGNIIAIGTLVELINLLNRKDTIKIQKTALTQNKLSALREMGLVNEFDFYFELMPKDGYEKNSKIFGKLEEIGIPNDFIQISRATLEDVFLNLTGRSLRD